MLKLESFKQLLGFGNGSKYGAGEYYYSQGMKRSQHGIVPGWKTTETANSGVLTDLVLSTFFAQAYVGTSMLVYKVDNAGNIFQSANGNGAWALAYKPGVTTHGNGLIGDQKGRLLYLTTRYLGLYDSTVANYTTGTIAVTNGSAAVVGTGTTFVAGDVDKRIVIGGVWYTISAFTDATHITLSAVFAGLTASGLAYAIYRGWNDKYQDFGASSLADAADLRDADTYEDWVVMASGFNVAIYNVTDNSFNATSAFTLPSNFKVVSARSGRTGVLIGSTLGSRSVLTLWDAQSVRSIAPWIWLKGNIQCIKPYLGNWIVITDREILLTNGYTVENLPDIPDSVIESVMYFVLPQGAEVIGNRLIIANSLGSLNRLRAGVWILDLTTKLWEFVPVANGATFRVNMRAVFADSMFRIHVAWQTQLDSQYHIGYLNNSLPARAELILAPVGQGNNQKTAIGLHPTLAVSSLFSASLPITVNVAVKVYNFKRNLWNTAQQKVLAVDYNKITVDGTSSGVNNADVGDEVTVCEGVNAGKVAHITAISGQNTSTEIWTLDTSFPAYTESGAAISVTPFKLLRKIPISNATQLRDLYFDCKNQIQGRRYLLKLVLDGMDNMQPELLGGDFYYDDNGIDIQ